MTAYVTTMVVLHLLGVYFCLKRHSGSTNTADKRGSQAFSVSFYGILAAWGFVVLIEHLQAVAP